MRRVVAALPDRRVQRPPVTATCTRACACRNGPRVTAPQVGEGTRDGSEGTRDGAELVLRSAAEVEAERAAELKMLLERARARGEATQARLRHVQPPRATATHNRHAQPPRANVPPPRATARRSCATRRSRRSAFARSRRRTTRPPARAATTRATARLPRTQPCPPQRRLPRRRTPGTTLLQRTALPATPRRPEREAAPTIPGPSSPAPSGGETARNALDDRASRRHVGVGPPCWRAYARSRQCAMPMGARSSRSAPRCL